MDLHEQVETLKRRGMPEHPRLRPPTKYHDGWWTQDELLEDAWETVHSDDARDLITMHALRWFQELGDRHVIFGATANRGKPGVGAYQSSPQDEGRAPEAIAAILAATAHLEPAHA